MQYLNYAIDNNNKSKMYKQTISLLIYIVFIPHYNGFPITILKV